MLRARVQAGKCVPYPICGGNFRLPVYRETIDLMLSPDLPPLSVIQAALCKTTETLARELGQPTEAAPAWSEFEWLMARAVAAMHGVSALLAGSLRWSGPAAWRRFLQTQRAHTAERHTHIEALLQLVDRATRYAGIAALALKGAELHAMDLYRPGERPMGDVDLLVRAADLSNATRVLESLGFHEYGSSRRHRLLIPVGEHLPAPCLGEHADNFLKIELHECIGELLPLKTVDITERLYPAHPHPGLNRYPSRASLMIHLLLHAAGAMASRSLRVLQLHDIALLSARMTEADWEEALLPRDGNASCWWARPLLLLTARYYPAAIPPHILVTVAAGCPRLLRRVVRRRTLSEISLSSLSIAAFPGIEWSQSISEAARFVVSRVLPNREVLELRKQVVSTRISASATQWQQLSQARRMWLWLTARQPRAETLYPVRLALSEAHERSREAP
jgi:hypothetical protein